MTRNNLVHIISRITNFDYVCQLRREIDPKCLDFSDTSFGLNPQELSMLKRLPKRKLYTICWDALKSGVLQLGRAERDEMTAEWVTLYYVDTTAGGLETVDSVSSPELAPSNLEEPIDLPSFEQQLLDFGVSPDRIKKISRSDDGLTMTVTSSRDSLQVIEEFGHSLSLPTGKLA